MFCSHEWMILLPAFTGQGTSEFVKVGHAHLAYPDCLCHSKLVSWSSLISMRLVMKGLDDLYFITFSARRCWLRTSCRQCSSLPSKVGTAIFGSLITPSLCLMLGAVMGVGVLNNLLMWKHASNLTCDISDSVSVCSVVSSLRVRMLRKTLKNSSYTPLSCSSICSNKQQSTSGPGVVM